MDPSRALGEKYEVLRQVAAATSNRRVNIGSKGKCRFCGKSNPDLFRTIAHTFPQSLGNKWVISLDECDACNQLFSAYDDSLATAVSAISTLGGVRGKENKIRQTGRTAGNEILRRSEQSGKPNISMIAKGYDFREIINVDPESNVLLLKAPLPPVRFRPRFAYKALAKMGVALLPDSELGHYRKLRKWLLDKEDVESFTYLEVGLSFSSLGHSPDLVAGTLLRRMDPKAPIPHIIFLFSAGSVCFQLDLMSDELENHLPPLTMGTLNINYSNVISGDGDRSITLSYGKPIHMDWSSKDLIPQPVEAFLLRFNLRTNEGHFSPIFRT